MRMTVFIILLVSILGIFIISIGLPTDTLLAAMPNLSLNSSTNTTFNTSQSPYYAFGEGNYSIKLESTSNETNTSNLSLNMTKLIMPEINVINSFLPLLLIMVLVAIIIMVIGMLATATDNTYADYGNNNTQNQPPDVIKKDEQNNDEFITGYGRL